MQRPNLYPGSENPSYSEGFATANVFRLTPETRLAKVVDSAFYTHEVVFESFTENYRNAR